jgi:hypothetical protein
MNDDLHLSLGARNFIIKFLSSEQLAVHSISEDVVACGYTDYSSSSIVLQNDVKRDFLCENLCHEILHVLIDNSAAHLVFDDEEKLEKFIRLLTPRFHEFLIRNKDLIGFINIDQE